jgi:hypothetical protein
MQGTGGGHIGYRFSQYNSGSPNPYADQGSNISGTTLLNCTINGDYRGSAPSTSIGVQFGGGEVKPNRVIGCAVGGLGCDYLVGSIATLLSQGVTATQTTLPINDMTLFKPNGSNTRYVVIGQGGPNPEQCTYTGVAANAVIIPAAPSLAVISGTSNNAEVFVVITLVNSVGGETPGSSQSTFTPTATQQVVVISPGASGYATGYNVYVGSASVGPYFLQNTTMPGGAAVPIAIGTAFTIPGTPYSTGNQPAPVLTIISPGTSNGAAVYVVITLVDPFGETTASLQNKSTPTQQEQVRVGSPLPFGDATGYNIYVGSASGGPYYVQNLQNGVVVPIPIGTPYLIPGTPASSGKQPPVVNSTGGLTGTLTGVGRGANGTIPSTWGTGSTVKEYQQNIGVYGGGDDIVWVECDGSNSLRVFYLQEVGGTCYSILGGRWELLPEFGQRFLQTGLDVVSKPRFERMYTEVSADFRGIWSRPEGFETTS